MQVVIRAQSVVSLGLGVVDGSLHGTQDQGRHERLLGATFDP